MRRQTFPRALEGNLTGDYLRFLVIAISSLKETEYFLLLALDLGYLAEDQFNALTETVNGTFGALQGLIKTVKNEV